MDAIYFKPEEFTCKCGCGFMNIDQELVSILDEIRDVLGKPLIIRSGCRCEKRNEEEGGEKNSDHLLGRAADVKAISSHTRFLILNYALAFGINRIGIAKDYLHLGMNVENPQNVLWLYP